MHKYLFVLTTFVVVAAATCTSPAWAGWGCGAISTDGTEGRARSDATEADARKDSIKYCANGGHKGCKVISCSDNVDTQDQAHALWPSTGTVNKCFGTGPCETGRKDDRTAK